MNAKLTFLLSLITFLGFSQTPQLINYQGVARDASGTPVTGNIGLKFELRQGSATSGTVFTELQTVTTGSLGVFSTQIGKTTGSNLNTIDWEGGSLFLEVSVSLSGGTYTSMGAQQLVSVPFALEASSVPATYTNNILTIGSHAFTLTPSTGAIYTASTGISITSGSVITNTAPDVPVTFTSSSSNISINGSYPNFDISYTSTPVPTSLTLNGINNNSLSAGNNTVVLNTYTVGSGLNMTGGPNYTINSSSASPTVEGAGVALVTPTTGTSFTVTVPNPSVLVTGTLLTLTQGTAVSTATLNPPTLALSGINNNNLSAGNNTVVLNTYTSGAGITISGGPNYTIASSAANPTINGAGVAAVTPTTGSNFIVTVPDPSVTITSNTLLTLTQGTAVSTATLNPPTLALSGTNNNSLSAGNNTVVLNTYTPGAGITMSGGPNYTIASSAANPTINGAGVAAVTPTTGSNFIVTVPDPSVTITSNTLLTLTQGTAVSTATLNSPTLALLGTSNNSLSAGNNTVVLNTYTPGAGITMSGGPNYTIASSALNPTINGAGVAVVTPTTGSNFIVTVPNPSVSVSNTLLTLTQGTSTSTTTLSNYTVGSGLTMSGGPNYTISSSASNPTINGAGVAVVSPTTGSNFIVTVADPSIAVAGNTLLTLSQGTAVSTATINPPTLSLSGTNNNSLTAGNNTVALNTYTVGSGLTIAGGPNYTISSTAANPTINGTGIAVVSPTTGSNFAVNVPGPVLSVTGTTLGISQGTASSSATLPTTTVTASGIASVAVSGLSYNVNVPTPSFLSTGATSIQGSYPNYTVATASASNPTIVGSGAAVVSPSTGLNFSVNVPLTSITATSGIATITSAGTNSFNVSVPSPTYNAVTGALNTGTAATNITPLLTLTNNILTSGPANNTVTIPAMVNTSISPAGSASVTGAFPSFTISTPAQPTIVGAGLAVVTPTSGANITVSVPLLTYTPATGVLASGTNTLNITQPLVINGTTLSSGPSSNSVNLNSISPFTSTGANIYQSTLTNSVGIGTNVPSAKLEVIESVTYTGSHLKVQNVNPSNTSNMVDLISVGGGNVLNVFSNNSATTAVAASFDGGIISKGKTITNQGYAFRALNSISSDLFVVRNDGNVGLGTSNPSALFQVVNTSLFDAIAADVTNVSNGGNALQIRHFGVGNAGFFQVNNTTGGSAIEATSNSGSQNTVRAVSSNANLLIYAGFFDGGLVTRGKNTLNTAYSFRAQNSGSSDLLAVLNDGNVGIGTSSPATKLHLHSSTSNFVQARLTHTATSTFGLVLSSDNLSAALLNYDNTPLFFGTNGANRMVISNTGSVGIGTGAMTPAARLDVDGTVKIKDGTEGPGKVLTSDAVGNASWQAVLPVPSGAMMPYAGPTTTIPSGWVVCDGAAYPRTGLYVNLFAAIGTSWGAPNGTTFNVPDMRGMFLRGVDGGSGNDPNAATRFANNAGGNTGNNVGSEQADEFESHSHTTGNTINGALLGVGMISSSGAGNNTGNAGGSTETRPKNVYVYYIIKL